MADDYYLAEKLHMTVAELYDRVSAAEYVEWMAYFRVKAQTAEIEQKAAAARMGR